MRKLNFFLGLSAMSLTMLISSCSDENALGPGLELLCDAAVTAPANSTITISWRASAGDANLESFTIKEGNAAVVDEDGVDWTAFNIPNSEEEAFESSAVVAIGAENTSFTLIVTDNDGLTATETVTVTVTAPETPLTAKGTSEMGAGGSALPSYYSVVDDQTLSLSEAKASPNKVDFVFTSTASTATFKSPKDAAAAEISGTNRVTNYQKVTTIDFDNATEEDIAAITPTADNITVALNDVIVFKTHDNTKGVFKVNQLTVAADGTITIDIKIKQ
jgi:hypothetical protein